MFLRCSVLLLEKVALGKTSFKWEYASLKLKRSYTEILDFQKANKGVDREREERRGNAENEERERMIQSMKETSTIP